MSDNLTRDYIESYQILRSDVDANDLLYDSIEAAKNDDFKKLSSNLYIDIYGSFSYIKREVEFVSFTDSLSKIGGFVALILKVSSLCTALYYGMFVKALAEKFR